MTDRNITYTIEHEGLPPLNVPLSQRETDRIEAAAEAESVTLGNFTKDAAAFFSERDRHHAPDVKLSADLVDLEAALRVMLTEYADLVLAANPTGRPTHERTYRIDTNETNGLH